MDRCDEDEYLTCLAKAEETYSECRRHVITRYAEPAEEQRRKRYGAEQRLKIEHSFKEDDKEQ